MNLAKKTKTYWENLSEKKHDALSFLIFFFVLTAVTTCLYWEFLTKQSLMVYVGVGSDSFNQSVPFLMSVANKFANFDFSSWDSTMYLGGTSYLMLDPEYWISIFGTEHVATMLGLAQILKVLLAGVFAYLFVRQLGLSCKTAYVIGLGLAFCGRVIALTPWFYYTTEVTIIIIVLWAFERFYNNRHHFIALPLAFGFLVLVLSVYGLMLYSVVLLGYSAFRLGFSGAPSMRKHPYVRFILQLLGLYLAALFIAAPSLLPSIETYLNSARVTSNLSTANTVLTLFTPLGPGLEETLKFFSIGILGSMTSYSGVYDYLATPYFYCGLLALIAIPFAFTHKTRRQRICLSAILAAVLLYCVFPPVRYALNGFATGGDEFRLSSFWVTVVLVILGSYGLEELFNRNFSKRTLLIWTTLLIAVLGVVSALYINHVNHISKPAVVLSVGILVAYGALLLIWRKSNKTTCRYLPCIIILILIPLEAFFQSYPIVNESYALTPDSYLETYNSGLSDTLESLPGSAEGDFRIDYKSLLLTRSMSTGYMGTQAYIGGTGLTQTTTDFLKAFGNDYIEQLGYSRYVYGSYDNALNTLLGVRYLVYDKADNNYVPYGYSKVDVNSYYRVYENESSLPLFYTYSSDEAISQTDFLKTSREERGEQMLETIVLPDEQSSGSEGAAATSNNTTDTLSAQLLATTDDAVTKTQAAELDIPASDSPYLLLKMNLGAEASQSGCLTITTEFFPDDSDTPSSKLEYLTAAGNEQIAIPVASSEYRKIRVSINHTNLCDDAVVSGIGVYGTTEAYFDRYRNARQERLKDSPVVEEYSNSRLVGTVDMTEQGYIATSIPWSKSWHAYVDGQETDTFVANLGFIGFETPEGHHDINIVYKDTAKECGLWLFLASIGMITVAKVITVLRSRKKKEMQKE